MRLTWFEVEGDKNIRDPLRLDELSSINVLHGDTNVGKSNLLEAIGLFFVLLQTLREDDGGHLRLSESFARRSPPEGVGTGPAARHRNRTFSHLFGRPRLSARRDLSLPRTSANRTPGEPSPNPP